MVSKQINLKALFGGKKEAVEVPVKRFLGFRFFARFVAGL
jgi:hypothetical protein